MDTTNIVYYMGASFCILALSKFIGVRIEPIFILCYSIAAFILLIHEIWLLFHVKINGIKGKNVKRSFLHNPVSNFFKNKRTGEFFIYMSMLAIIFLPHLPFLRNLNSHTISFLSDFMSLFALGLTLIIIGFKQLKPAEEDQVKKHLIELPEERDVSNQSEANSKGG